VQVPACAGQSLEEILAADLEELRPNLSLRIDAPLWSYRTIAVVDVSAGDAEAIWPIVRNLASLCSGSS